jgi:hypothetical protein
VIALPLFAPAVNDTTNEPVAVVVEPETALTFVGAAGDPTITGSDGADGRPAPRAFDPRAEHVYFFIVVRPVTVNGDAAPVTVPLTPLSDEVHVAVKPVIAFPLFAPAVNETTNEPVAVVVEPETALTFVGAAGDPTITAGDDGGEAGLEPRPFVALTVHP